MAALSDPFWRGSELIYHQIGNEVLESCSFLLCGISLELSSGCGLPLELGSGCGLQTREYAQVCLDRIAYTK